MTVWKAGMLAVCVDERAHPDSRTSLSFNVVASFLAVGRGYLVRRVDDDCLRLVGDPFPLGDFGGYKAIRFRPVVEDRDRCEDEFITLLNLSKPAPAQSHEVKALVPVRDQTLSSITDGFAAAMGATVSNLVGVCVQRESAPHHMNADPVTHRDLSQHADSNSADSFKIVPHVERNS